MKYLLSITLIGLLAISCKKKLVHELIEVPESVYTIKGVLYDADGVTPVPNRRLVLSVRGGYSLTGYGNDIGYTQVISTDQGGRYNFNYPTLNLKVQATLAISQHHAELPAIGDLLKDIPIHQNIERDICSSNISYGFLLVKVKGPGAIYLSDTLETGLYTRSDSGAQRVRITHPFLDSTYKIEWDRSYGGKYSSILWAVGATEYNKYWEWKKQGNHNEEYLNHWKDYHIRGFPFTDTLIIETF